MLPCLSCCPLSDPPLSCLSCMHLSIGRFGRPLLLFPGMSTSNILLTMCSSFILLTWPYHFTRFSVIFLDACSTLGVPLMCSFWILSLLVTPHIHLSILISFTSSVLLVPSLSPRFLHHTTELVGPQFCKPSPPASLAYSCHTTLHCISSIIQLVTNLARILNDLFKKCNV